MANTLYDVVKIPLIRTGEFGPPIVLDEALKKDDAINVAKDYIRQDMMMGKYDDYKIRRHSEASNVR